MIIFTFLNRWGSQSLENLPGVSHMSSMWYYTIQSLR